ncbi:Protein phosphatase 5 [Heterostelium album PN500]|uniref:protein-serine/threonine phosphatase n=1 Tax=Heterostelium pallidum (strain ATCC 26659 / Pp 5 / PN500) TaxID=670386 RepID=D3BM76_HETP5|nr:Protein phosphatase 5 [Heterostelium album PN500]EFA77677.1 Protein phosphatase 5 [Heterostelium album PN500]|eukprot:XP_020429805.1 Protein phosphatase 5 [Heterostelium album PN500]
MPIQNVVEFPQRKKEANSDISLKSPESTNTTASNGSGAHHQEKTDPNFVDPSTLSAEERLKKSDEYKAKANKLFGDQKFDLAVDEYSKAIEYHPTAILYSNRSFSYFKKELFVSALDDAKKATELDPMYVKGYYRLGSANMALGHYQDAKINFQTVVKKFPNDNEGRQKLKTVSALIQRKAFEDAIQFSAESAFKNLDYESMAVDESYKGPHFIGEDITLEFVKDMIEYMKSQKSIHKKYILKILKKSFDLFTKLPSLVDIDHETTQNITVCGDTHGQFYDLLHIFELNGLPSKEKPYLFNGDFVDRGSFSLEVIVTLLAFKLLYPDHMHLTRGNHESIEMNRFYGFHGEVVAKYSEMVYDLFAELFSWFPLAFVLDNSYLVVHGGLFDRDGVTLDDIRKINRASPDSNDNALLQCLLWSDPQQNPGILPSSRGVGVYFGPDVTRKFLKENNLCGVIRSHEVKENGYQIDDEGSIITIFSAPNYCDQSGNLGAYINFGKDTLKFTTFSEVPHPDIGPIVPHGYYLLPRGSFQELEYEDNYIGLHFLTFHFIKCKWT